MKHRFGALIMLGYAAVSFLLFLFSYTQVDLNLTLSRVGVLQQTEKAFQYIGYYQRPLATSIYVGILAAYFGLYALLLSRLKKDGDSVFVWRIIGTVTALLVLSYPATFSYDFFNYMFTAKTVLVYHQNPYAVVPLQFSSIDPWTNFMRWTHLSTAYAPLWIALTFVPYLLGLGFFLPVLFAMKGMIAVFYLIAAYMIFKATNSARALAIFALNPLILLESLVSGHNDVVMGACAMAAVYLYERKDYWNGWLLLSVSVAAKLMTIVLIPLWFLKKNRIWFLAAMLTGVAAVLLKREFLPWYWVWVLPFVSLLPDREKIVRFAAIVSLGLAASYTPYFYFGTYSAEEQMWKTALIWIGVAAGIVSYIFPVSFSGIKASKPQVPER